MTQIFTHKTLSDAAQLIRDGEVVAFPTETVYGLGANALNEEAVKKIFLAKGRPTDNPLIIHIGKKKDIYKWCNVPETLKGTVRKLIQIFWPGPLTLILPKADEIPLAVTAGLPTVGIRMPDHSLAKKLIRAAGVPIAAPSANISGRPSSTMFEHVKNDFDSRIAGILQSKKSKIGLESTVVDLTVVPPVILRPGNILPEELQKVLPNISLYNKVGETAKAPGMKYKHYAPDAKVILFEKENLQKWEAIINQCKKDQKKLRILAPDTTKDFSNNLYALLRKADKDGVEVLLIKPFNPKGMGQTLLNRLRKSASEIVD